jgi:DNA-directed RNA polymerase subunit RPC12/RpoP
MRFATNGNNERFEAGPDAPEVAKCPQCGYTVMLRGRKKFGRDEEGKTWFYRHNQGFPKTCPLRSGPGR